MPRPLDDTEARSFLHYFLFTGDDPLRPSQELSYGERARLSLAMLVAQGCNFLLLDEPINHLDIPARTRFEQALAQFEGTVLAVVHDRYFIERFADELWLVAGGGVSSVGANTYFPTYHLNIGGTWGVLLRVQPAIKRPTPLLSEIILPFTRFRV